MNKMSRLISRISVVMLFIIYANVSYAQQQIQINPLFSGSGTEAGSITTPQKTPSMPSGYTGQKETGRETEAVSEQLDSVGAGPAEGAKEEVSSDFERFITGEIPSEVSTKIEQFGYDIFEKPVDFVPSKEIPVGPDYVIGPGDELRITVWGNIEGTWDAVVDRDGNIRIPKVGVIGVTGLTFSEVKELLRNELSKYYIGFQMNVSMGSLRTIKVYVVGNASSPGAYTVSALSTLVNALIRTGGPSKVGTMRDIQLKRNGNTVVHFDMYDFLLRGDKSKDVRLLPEDIIFIPPVGPLAGIAGSVKRPAIYELRGETKLLDLIQMAGGLSSIAFKGRVQRQRIENHRFRTMYEGDLIGMEDNEDKNFTLKDGDLIKIFSVTDTGNMVNISGAVVNEGEYAIQPGVTRVKDVIEKAGGLLYYAADNAELTRVQVTQDGPRTKYININVAKAMDRNPEHNIALEINDYLFIRTIPEWRLYRTVTIEGEVKFPGTYTIKNGETLSSLIERAGGYTDNAYLRGAVFTRESVREIQQRSLVEMVERLETRLFSEGSAEVATALSKEEIEAKKAELESRRRFIERLKQLKATGRMTIRLAHLRLLKGSEYDIELEEGDNLFIPVKNKVINVTGAVMSRGSFVYSEKFDHGDYVEMAGGYTKFADDDNVYVLKVDGTAARINNGFFNWNSSKSRWEVTAFGEEIKGLEPGDSIVVPEKLDRIAWLREIKDVTQIIYQIAVAAGVTIVLF